MYADDLAIIASSADELQAMLDIVTKWRYRINPLKSKVLPFGSNRLPTTTWTIKGQKVEGVKEHLHLGILRSTAPSLSAEHLPTSILANPLSLLWGQGLDAFTPSQPYSYIPAYPFLRCSMVQNFES